MADDPPASPTLEERIELRQDRRDFLLRIQGSTSDSQPGLAAASLELAAVDDSRLVIDFIIPVEGPAGGKFDSPLGIATDSSGNIYVADTENHRIQKFDSNREFYLCPREYEDKDVLGGGQR